MDLSMVPEMAPNLFAIVTAPDLDGPDVAPAVAAFGLRYPDALLVRFEYPPAMHRVVFNLEDVDRAVEMVRARCGSGRLVWIFPSDIACS